MIKVIKHGKNPFKTTCESCGCVYSFSKSDISVQDDQETFGIGCFCYFIKCPDCKSKFIWQEMNELEINE